MRAYGRVSEEFDIITGIRQGDVLAPTLFSLFFDAVIATVLARHPTVVSRFCTILEMSCSGAGRG